MTDTGSVFSKGGGGTNFEHYIQTAFLTSMIVNGNVPGIKDSSIVEIAIQTTRLGYKTDDLFIRCISPMGEHRLVAQIKHEFSFTIKNETFKEVIDQLWNDFNNHVIFNPKLDKLLIIKENLNKTEANNIKTLINWAKSKSSASDFILETKRIEKKENTLNVFRTVIEEVNEGKRITDEEIWNFLKCLELLAYDFGNHDSTHQAYFLNLIKLSKSSKSRLSESEIWSQLYEFISVRNKDGGQFNLESIVQESFFTHFKPDNLNLFYNSLSKLKRDSEIILKQLSNEIHGFHIERVDLKQQITESINNNTITFISGTPGVGKSAIIKDVLREEFPHSHLMVFRADQLNAPNLTNVFSSLGINDSIQDILSCISTTPQKIIFIDSLEKLLEGDSENAFKQLYNTIIQYPDIKIVAASRKYAIDLLFLKYGINKNHSQIIEISTLNDLELNLLKERFPQLEQIFTNTKIKQLLVTPKYIDFTLSLIMKDNSDYSQISLTDFKGSLWNHIVENITNRKAGLPRKRGKAFSSIAVARAKKMCLFVEPIEVNEEAIDELEHDNIIFRDGDNYMFSPSHDILEDWALIRYIDKRNVKSKNPKDFFTQMGTEPAIRRAFRLWVENSLIDDKEKIIELVQKSTEDNEIEKFWADEILIAIFKSDNCQTFFTDFQTNLLEDNHSFLKRCIHLIRTTCKERDLNNSNLLFPIGSGWYSMMKLISENIAELEDSRNLITNFLLEWEYKTYLTKKLPSESIYVKGIIIHYLNQIQNQEEFWLSYSHDNKYNGIISLFFNIVSISKDYAFKLIDHAVNYKREDSNWQLRAFYDKIIEYCLSGIYSKNVVKEFPDKICEVAWKSWKYVATNKTGQFDFDSSIEINHYFGLKDYLDDFPAGIYKTPFWNMLWTHPYKAFDFIIDFINYCCNNYFKSEFAKEDDTVEIELKISNDKIIKQKSSYVLWQAYRGTGKVTPDVFRSVLISLEKFLLTIAGYKNKSSRELIKHYFNYLLERSNNVAISSVLTSLCIAYPEELEECLLSILRVEEFYRWDLSRAYAEHQALSPDDMNISFAQKEMFEHNHLPHRKKYQRGLCDFIFQYQVNIRTLNNEIHEIIDDFLKNLNDKDITWKKLLCEMDARNWELGEYDKESGGIIVQPKYEDEVKKFVDTNKPQLDEQNLAATHSLWTYKKFKNENNVECEFENWQKSYSYLKDKKNYDYIVDKPGTLAYVGLRDYNNNLSQKEIEWCVNSLVDSLIEIQSESRKRYDHKLPEFNPLDKEPCLKSFSLILKHASLNPDDEKELVILLFYCLTSPIPRHEKEYLIEDFRNNMWEIKPQIANNIWDLLIEFSAFKKTNHYYYDDPNQERIQDARKKEFDYITNQILIDPKKKDEEISFETHVGHLLLLNILLLPFDDKIHKHQEFIKTFLSLFFEAIYGDEGLYEEFRKIQIKNEQQRELIKYSSKYLLIQNPMISKNLLESLLDKYYSLLEEPRKVNDIHNFIEQSLHSTICELDLFVRGKNEYKNYSLPKFVKNFWSVWNFLHQKITDSGNLHFSEILFLDFYSNKIPITWDENDKDWMPLLEKEKYFEQLVLEKGHANIRAIINVFVSIGHTKLLPHGLNWLVDVLKQNPNKLTELITPKGERLVENLFHYYCLIIKEDRLLLDNFIWLLGNMIDLGSSLAYQIRENAITYKSN